MHVAQQVRVILPKKTLCGGEDVLWLSRSLGTSLPSNVGLGGSDTPHLTALTRGHMPRSNNIHQDNRLASAFICLASDCDMTTVFKFQHSSSIPTGLHNRQLTV